VISKPWRERLTYTAMSAFIVWHVAAMSSAPTPDDGKLPQALRAFFQPYLSLLRLDNRWDFFAPEVGKNAIFRYVIKDAAGKEYMFVPARELNWFSPGYIWFQDWYGALMEHPDIYADDFAKLFCKKHAALNPVSITFQEMQELDYVPDDRLAGKKPLDPEFVKITDFQTIKCADVAS